ncbi:MAG: PAS domain S-box protein [Microcoleus sp.]
MIPEISPTNTPQLSHSLTDLQQEELALQIAWEELEKSIEQTILQTPAIDQENAQQLSDRFVRTKQLCHEFKTHMKQAVSRLDFHIENSPMAVIEWDSSFRVVRWSPQAETMFGWTTAEIVGKDWHDLPIVYESDSESVNSIADRLLDGSEIRSISCNRNYTKDGSIIYCEWYCSVLKDTAGKVISVLNFVRDVTERQHTQKEVCRRERDFSAIAENATDVIARYDRQLRHLYINKAVEIATGEPPAVFIGKTNQESGMPEDFCNLFDEHFAKIFRDRQQETIEFEFLTPQGIRHYHCRVVPEFAVDNSVETVLTICRDITELKQAEFELKKHQELLESILKTIPNLLYIYDTADNKLIYVNESVTTMLGYTAGELEQLGTEAVADLIHPDDRLKLITGIKRLKHSINSQKINNRDYRIKHKNGEWRWVHDRARIFQKNSEGKTWQIIGSVLDISDRKQAEASLNQQKEVLQTIFDSVPVMLAFFDKKGETIWVNRHWEQVLGWNLAEIKDSDLLAELYPNPEYRQSVLDFIAAATENWADFKTTVRDGRIIDTTWANVRLSDGGCIGIGQDISDRKQVEAELKQLNETLEAQVAQRTAELETFFDTLPDHIFVIEQENLRFSFVNQSLVKFSGFDSRNQMQGKTIFECYSREIAARFHGENLQVFESGQILHLQEKFVRSGTDIYFDTLKIPLRNLDGEVYALIGTSRNITELVETKQALSERTVQLEAANKELESFCYSISHDLRAPLRHISGFVNALKQRLETTEAPNDRKIAHYIEVIEDSTEKMSLLIDGLLMLSRVGRAELMQIPIELDRLVQTAIKLAKPLAPASCPPTPQNVEFEIGNLPAVTGDPTLLQQVFSNLIGNAVKFSRDRTPARIVIDSLPDGTIFVKDNGAGFNMEYADRLFGAFQRLHSQREFEGTGIGLAIVQRIIHRHGGTIWAEGAPSQGATFYFKLSRTVPAGNGEF